VKTCTASGIDTVRDEVIAQIHQDVIAGRRRTRG
jgi:hypothetical protein